MDQRLFFEDDAGSMTADATFSPLLVVTAAGVLSEKVVSDYFAWGGTFVADMKERRQSYVVLVDALDAGIPSPAARALISSRTDDLRLLAAGADVGSVIVVESGLVRGALTAMRWLSRSNWSPIPARNIAAGLAIACELLARAGMPTPSAAQRAAYERPRRAPSKSKP